MKSSGHENIESLLTQMSLRVPTDRLDEAIKKLADESHDARSTPRARTSGRFGWPALLTTALVASVGGVLLGHFSSLNQTSGELIEPVASVTRPGQSNSADITPVSFNVAAFDMLHGHSTNQEYANCGACHVDDEKEAFEGWFYGDEHFVKTEHSENVGKCSSCHFSAGDSNDHDEQFLSALAEPGFSHADLQARSCSSCHGSVADGSKPNKPIVAGEHDHFHHFQRAQNCSNCHQLAKQESNREKTGA